MQAKVLMHYPQTLESFIQAVVLIPKKSVIENPDKRVYYQIWGKTNCELSSSRASYDELIILFTNHHCLILAHTSVIII